MTTTVTVKTRISVNGQEYGSMDDMPPDVRQAYERAMANVGATHHGLARLAATTPSTAVLSKIVFNGQEYAGVDQMPAEIRKLYESVMATLDVERVDGSGGAVASGTTVIPALSLATGGTRSESTTSRLVIAAAVVAALILASFVWGR